MIFDWCYGKRLARIEAKLNYIIKTEVKILASFADVKAMLDTLVLAVEGLIAKLSSGQIVSQADMDAAVAEMQAEIDKIKAIP